MSTDKVRVLDDFKYHYPRPNKLSGNIQRSISVKKDEILCFLYKESQDLLVVKRVPPPAAALSSGNGAHMRPVWSREQFEPFLIPSRYVMNVDDQEEGFFKIGNLDKCKSKIRSSLI